MSFSTTAVRSVAVPGLLLLLALAAALSLTIGAKSLPIGTVFTAFSGTCQSADCTIVLDARLPRTLAGLLAGVALGLAGALMQTLTRNPLADPGLLGSTPAPASPSSSARRCLGSLPAGAAAAGILRRALRLAAGSLYRQPGRRSAEPGAPHSRRGRPCGGTRGAVQRHRPAQPGRLRSATLLAGRFAGYPHPANAENCPAAGSGGGIAALLLSRALNSLSPGNDTATALGSRVARTQLIGLIVITVLCGSATAVVGPIAFIGLMMPHMARWLVGPIIAGRCRSPCSPPRPCCCLPT